MLKSLLKNTVFCWFLDKMVCIVVEGSFLKRFFCTFVFDIQSGDTVQSCFCALFRSYTHWWNQENFTKDSLKKKLFSKIFFLFYRWFFDFDFQVKIVAFALISAVFECSSETSQRKRHEMKNLGLYIACRNSVCKQYTSFMCCGTLCHFLNQRAVLFWLLILPQIVMCCLFVRPIKCVQ